MLLFRDEEHIKRSAKPNGATLTTGQMWRLADVWYHDRSDPGWRRRTAAEAETVFAQIGLIGEFWKLRT